MASLAHDRIPRSLYDLIPSELVAAGVNREIRPYGLILVPELSNLMNLMVYPCPEQPRRTLSLK
jgi:hypothetical protein